MFFGSATGVLDIACAGIASLLVLLAVIEIGGAYPFLIFAVTSVLSALVLPDKFGALVYICIIGWYPMLKRLIESRTRRTAGWILKIAVFNIALAGIFLLARFVLGDNEINTVWLGAAMAVISNVSFILFDIALTRLITLYLFRYRQRTKKIFR